MSDWECRNVNHWEKPEVTFTGFKSAERAELEALAEEFGMFVRRGSTNTTMFDHTVH